jgi:hypothetical protein
MKDFAVLIAAFWPGIAEVLVAFCIGFFIWGQVRPAKRRVAMKAMWICVALAFLFDLPLVWLLTQPAP